MPNDRERGRRRGEVLEWFRFKEKARDDNEKKCREKEKWDGVQDCHFSLGKLAHLIF